MKAPYQRILDAYHRADLDERMLIVTIVETVAALPKLTPNEMASAILGAVEDAQPWMLDDAVSRTSVMLNAMEARS